MRDILENILEADIFKGATQSELLRRQAAAKARYEEERAALEKKIGHKIDFCPNPECKIDLRGEYGVYGTVVAYETERLYWDANRGEWEYGDRDTHDAETTGYHCGKCDYPVRRGRDFDYQGE